MTSVVCRDLAGQWGLESISKLPIDEKCNSLLLYESNSSNVVDCNLEHCQISFMITMLRSTIIFFATESKRNNQNASTKVKIECSIGVRAASIPLYHSFMRQISHFVPLALSRSRQPHEEADQLQHDETCLRNLLQQEKLADFAKALHIIEFRQEFNDMFKEDFISITLEYAKHTPQELLVLMKVAESLTFLSGPPNLQGSNPISNVCRWVISQNKIKSYLFAPSQLLLFARSIISAKDLNELSGNAHANIIVPENLVRYITELCINQLWNFVVCQGDNEMQSFMTIEVWITSIRDLSVMECFSPEILTDDRRSVLSESNATKFAVMIAIYKILSVDNSPCDTLVDKKTAFGGDYSPHAEFNVFSGN